MCGISGYFSNDSAYEPCLLSMLEAISYRGPDSVATYKHNGFSLGAVRLSIVDLDHGTQPMVHEPTGICVAWNGEIFNYIEIRDQLKSKGHAFFTGSDTEVLLRSYLEWGINCVSRFNGQFAISIADPRNNLLHLIRDRVGICPLFYTTTASGLVFASEIKSILCSGAIRVPELNTSALGELFSFWTPIHDSSFVRGIQQVLPAEILTLNTNTLLITKKRYWQWPALQQPSPVDFSKDVEELGEHLDKAIRLRLRSDVEVAAYLSGGLDSSYMVCAMGKMHPQGTHTFSLTFNDQQYNEKNFQDEVSSVANTVHHEFLCDESLFPEKIEEVIRHTEAPLFRISPLPLFGLSESVHNEDIRVVLTGEGADELFLGYHILRETRLRLLLKKYPANRRHKELFASLFSGNPQLQNNRFANLLVDGYRSTLNKFPDDYFSHAHRWANNISNWVYVKKEIRNLWDMNTLIARLRSALPADFSERSIMERGQLLDVSTLMQNYLLSSQGDRMLLGHSVEGRFPFLDHELIEFMAEVPDRHKLNGLHEKYIFKELSKKIVPENIIKRKKFPYETPEVKPFFNLLGKESPLIEKYLSEDSINETGIFEFENVRLLLTKFRMLKSERFSARDSQAFIQILTTQIFAAEFIHDNWRNKEVSEHFKSSLKPPQIFKA